MKTNRRIVFVTGTRADFGKMKTLMARLQADMSFEVHVFVTGMHLLAKYGYTCEEVEKAGFKNIHKFINQNPNDSMDHILAKTISGLSDYIHEIQPSLLVIHGDRVEALAGASVGALNHLLVAHVEGGEVSGTIDELIRHAVTKLSHVHFAANDRARTRLLQLGEEEDSIFVVGSPDIDVMNSPDLPSIESVRSRYGIQFKHYGILIFHPVTSEHAKLGEQIKTVVDSVLQSERNYVVIYPNNDLGSSLILEEYRRFEGNDRIKVFPSMRFEFFLSLLRGADFIIGNSSSGIREAPHYGVPTLNIGSRQFNRVQCETVLNVPVQSEAIRRGLLAVDRLPRRTSEIFGTGDSAIRFHEILLSDSFWDRSPQKHFVDREPK